jgi:hypothetical protein
MFVIDSNDFISAAGVARDLGTTPATIYSHIKRQIAKPALYRPNDFCLFLKSEIFEVLARSGSSVKIRDAAQRVLDSQKYQSTR